MSSARMASTFHRRGAVAVGATAPAGNRQRCVARAQSLGPARPGPPAVGRCAGRVRIPAGRVSQPAAWCRSWVPALVSLHQSKGATHTLTRLELRSEPSKRGLAVERPLASSHRAAMRSGSEGYAPGVLVSARREVLMSASDSWLGRLPLGRVISLLPRGRRRPGGGTRTLRPSAGRLVGRARRGPGVGLEVDTRRQAVHTTGADPRRAAVTGPLQPRRGTGCGTPRPGRDDCGQEMARQHDPVQRQPARSGPAGPPAFGCVRRPRPGRRRTCQEQRVRRHPVHADADHQRRQQPCLAGRRNRPGLAEPRPYVRQRQVCRVRNVQRAPRPGRRHRMGTLAGRRRQRGRPPAPGGRHPGHGCDQRPRRRRAPLRQEPTRSPAAVRPPRSGRVCLPSVPDHADRHPLRVAHLLRSLRRHASRDRDRLGC